MHQVSSSPASDIMIGSEWGIYLKSFSSGEPVFTEVKMSS